MTPAAEDLARYLGTVGVGTFAGVTGWGIYANDEPTSPDNTITLYDTGGGEPDTEQLDLLRPTFQVRTRSKVYAEAYNKQEQVRDILTGGRLDTTRSAFVLIAMQSDIFPLGKDDNMRFILTANYRTIRERT